MYEDYAEHQSSRQAPDRPSLFMGIAGLAVITLQMREIAPREVVSQHARVCVPVRTFLETFPHGSHPGDSLPAAALQLFLVFRDLADGLSVAQAWPMQDHHLRPWLSVLAWRRCGASDHGTCDVLPEGQELLICARVRSTTSSLLSIV